MSKIIKSKEMYNPFSYIELITGKCYTGGAIHNGTVVKDIQNLLRTNGYYDLKSFPLDKIEDAMAEKRRVVLVDCSYYRGNMYIQEYRWFQTKTKIKEEKVNAG